MLADDEAGQVRPPALDVLGIDAVVADLRVGHRDDLAAVAGIGEDLLVAGHRRVEADFAVDFAIGADRSAGEDGAVFEGKFGGCGHASSIRGQRSEVRGRGCNNWRFSVKAIRKGFRMLSVAGIHFRPFRFPEPFPSRTFSVRWMVSQSLTWSVRAKYAAGS